MLPTCRVLGILQSLCKHCLVKQSRASEQPHFGGRLAGKKAKWPSNMLIVPFLLPQRASGMAGKCLSVSRIARGAHNQCEKMCQAERKPLIPWQSWPERPPCAACLTLIPRHVASIPVSHDSSRRRALWSAGIFAARPVSVHVRMFPITDSHCGLVAFLIGETLMAPMRNTCVQMKLWLVILELRYPPGCLPHRTGDATHGLYASELERNCAQRVSRAGQGSSTLVARPWMPLQK